MKCPNCNCEIELVVIVAGGGGPGDKQDKNAGTGKTPDKLKWGRIDYSGKEGLISEC